MDDRGTDETSDIDSTTGCSAYSYSVHSEDSKNSNDSRQFAYDDVMDAYSSDTWEAAQWRTASDGIDDDSKFNNTIEIADDAPPMVDLVDETLEENNNDPNNNMDSIEMNGAQNGAEFFSGAASSRPREASPPSAVERTNSPQPGCSKDSQPVFPARQLSRESPNPETVLEKTDQIMNLVKKVDRTSVMNAVYKNHGVPINEIKFWDLIPNDQRHRYLGITFSDDEESSEPSDVEPERPKNLPKDVSPQNSRTTTSNGSKRAPDVDICTVESKKSSTNADLMNLRPGTVSSASSNFGSTTDRSINRGAIPKVRAQTSTPQKSSVKNTFRKCRQPMEDPEELPDFSFVNDYKEYGNYRSNSGQTRTIEQPRMQHVPPVRTIDPAPFVPRVNPLESANPSSNGKTPFLKYPITKPSSEKSKTTVVSQWKQHGGDKMRHVSTRPAGTAQKLKRIEEATQNEAVSLVGSRRGMEWKSSIPESKVHGSTGSTVSIAPARLIVSTAGDNKSAARDNKSAAHARSPVRLAPARLIVPAVAAQPAIAVPPVVAPARVAQPIPNIAPIQPANVDQTRRNNEQTRRNNEQPQRYNEQIRQNIEQPRRNNEQPRQNNAQTQPQAQTAVPVRQPQPHSQAAVPVRQPQPQPRANVPVRQPPVKRKVCMEMYYKLRNIFPNIDREYVKQLCPPEWGPGDHDAQLAPLVDHLLTHADTIPPELPVVEDDRPDNDIMYVNDVDGIYENLLGIFPDADPHYLRDFAKNNLGRADDLKKFVESNLVKRDYPTRDEYMARLKITEQQRQYTTGFNVQNFLSIIPDPSKHFMNPQRKCVYDTVAFEFLKSLYNKNRVVTISKTYASLNYNLTLTADSLLRVGPELKSRRNVCDMPTEDIKLLQEIAFIKNRADIENHLQHVKEEESREFDALKKSNQLLQCQCCYDSECIPRKCSTCNNGHVFCNSCVLTGTNAKMSDGETRIHCFAGCESEFSLSVLQEVLGPTVFSKLLKERQAAEVLAAGLEGLVSCPFCHFASIPPEGDKIFKCLNPECTKESCRLCQKLSHVPFKCDDRPEVAAARHFVEEKMTDALARKCYKCPRRYIKEDGCNKISCPCGAMMCYLCDAPIKDYTHFSGQGSDAAGLCPLWSDSARLDAMAVRAVGERAQLHVQKRDPNVKIDTTALLPIIPRARNGPHDMIQNADQLPQHARRVLDLPPQ